MSSHLEVETKLYRHKHKKEWGYAVLAWEEPDRRRYQFQDGKLRTIGKGYYNLMERLPEPPKDKRAIVAELSRDLDASKTRHHLEKLDPDARRSVLSLDQQIEKFLKAFPEGFQDAKWLSEHRGTDAPKRLKRHRAFILESAPKLFDKKALKTEARAWLEELGTLLGKTDLVRKKDVEQLRLLAVPEIEGLRKAVRELSTPSESFGRDFDLFVTAVTPGGIDSPSWELVSTLLSIAAPKRYIPVKPSSFKKQAKWMAPNIKHKVTPSGAVYTEYLQMAQAIDRSLFRAGLQPADLIDVYDFIVLTTKK